MAGRRATTGRKRLSSSSRMLWGPAVAPRQAGRRYVHDTLSRNTCENRRPAENRANV